MRGRAGGFTLVELMVASTIFSMVIAALAAIYLAAFGQSGRTFREGRTKMMGNMAMNAFMNEVGQASYIEIPAKNASGTEVSGCQNRRSATDGGKNKAGVNSRRFHLCVRTTNLAGSTLCNNTLPNPQNPLNSPPCLFYYSVSSAGNCPNTDVTPATCGANSSALGSPQMLASGLEIATGMPADTYFTRNGGAGLNTPEDNVVRAAFKVTRPPWGVHPKLFYDVDTTATAQFGVSP